MRPVDKGVMKDTYFYPLAGITYCSHCERLAAEHNNPKRRSPFGGMKGNGIPRYRHKLGVTCGCTNRSVRCEVYEHDFTRLIKLLSVRPEAIDLMTELAIQADKVNGAPRNPADLEAEKRKAIALCQRRIEAAVHLYGDGRVSREEYLSRVEVNEREIAHWQTRTTETEKIALELAMCMEALDKIVRLWEISSNEDRQGLARSLFSYIVYDLDTQRIVDFRLKPWADRFLILRAALYEDEPGDDGTPGGGGETSEGQAAAGSEDSMYKDMARSPYGAPPYDLRKTQRGFWFESAM
jgi:hypothetical protein